MATGNVIAYVPSSSDPSKSYEVRLGGDGNVYCTCPNWKFQKLPPKERTCKHMKALSSQIATFMGKAAKAVAAPVAKKVAKAAPVAAPVAVPVVAVSEDAQIAALEAQLKALKQAKADRTAAAQAKVEAAKAALAQAEAELKSAAA